MVKSLALLSLTVPTSVVAGGSCDQNDCKCRGDCALAYDGNIPVELTCKFKVTIGQMLKVNNPSILQVDIGESCPRDEKGWIHDEACRQCGAHHIPCGGQFTACSGCCIVEVPKREHRCRDVKTYFLQKNHCDVSLEEETADKTVVEDPDVGFEVEDHLNDTFYSGTLVDGCDIDKKRVQCDKVPAVVDFNCNPCNKGSPLLLKKCCDECVKFSQSKKLRDYPGVNAFVSCQGCQTNTINMPGGAPMNWKYARQYIEHSRSSMDSKMEKWIEDNVCDLFEASNPKCQRRLLSSTEDSAEDLVCTTTTTTTVENTTTVAVATTTLAPKVDDPPTMDVQDASSAVPPVSVGFAVLALLISS